MGSIPIRSSPLPVFAVRKIAIEPNNSKIFLEFLRERLEREGYTNEEATLFRNFVKYSVDHPILVPIGEPGWQCHMTTCDHARPLQLLDRLVSPVHLTDYRIREMAAPLTDLPAGVKTQCIFDARIRWPRGLFRYQPNSDPTRADEYLSTHHDLLVATVFRFRELDFSHLSAILDAYNAVSPLF